MLRSRRARLVVLVLLAIVFLAFGFWWNADQATRSDQDAVELKNSLTRVVQSATTAEIRSALEHAQLGDYSEIDRLVPPHNQVSATVTEEGFKVLYRTRDHRPYRCFELLLSTQGSTVKDKGEC